MAEITAKEAAKLAGCSVSTLKRYCCGWCEQNMLQVARGHCGGMYWDTRDNCDPLGKAREFGKQHGRRKRHA